MKSLDDLKGWLIDLDGTLMVGDVLLPGASKFVQSLRENKYNFRFVSGTTKLSRRSIAERLRSLGIETDAEEIFTAASAAAELLKTFEGIKCNFVVAPELLEEFKEIESSGRNPDYVIIGDIGSQMDYEMLNKAFKLVMGGTELIALRKNRYYRNSEGLQIDAGAFVAALEYSSGKQAKIIGKPSRQFYNLAVHDIRTEANQRWLSGEFAMVGDDIEADIKGAMDAGLVGILVKTGRFNDSYGEHFGIVPDFTFDSIVELAEALSRK